MAEILEFEAQFVKALPETAELLRQASFAVHPGVTMVTLHGSRGLAGGARPDSDVDLGLIVEPGAAASESVSLNALLRNVLSTTLVGWKGAVEADLAAVFDARGCGLRCFERTTHREGFCGLGGVDCFGLYKIQKGFKGFVEGASIEVRHMYPCVVVWRSKD